VTESLKSIGTEDECDGIVSPPTIVDTAIVLHCKGLMMQNEDGPSASLLSFIAEAFRNTARFLGQCATAVIKFVETDYSWSTSLLLPYRNVMIERVVNVCGGFLLKLSECIGRARSQVSNRCARCASIAKSTGGIIWRTLPTQPEALLHPCMSITRIASDETMAENEIRRLREVVQEQKRKIIVLENKRNLRNFGKSPVDSEAEEKSQCSSRK
jgi:hypothetical protein